MEPLPEISALPFDVDRVRRDFAVLEREIHGHRLCYLDNAATSQRPKAVVDAIVQSLTWSNANIHRAIHTLGYEATVAYEEAHKKVARFINAKSWREIVFVRNATEALNLVAGSWGLANLRAGDEVVLTIMEHHSDIVPWQLLAARLGFVIKFIPVTADAVLDVDAAARLITPKTKLVGVVHASNVLGAINPVADLREMARKAGAKFLLDGAQSVPHMAVDVRALDCDFFAASGHKMCGPTGIGFLYAKKELLEAMPPFLSGGDMIATVTTEGSTWNELPWKFEAGTSAVAEGIGLGAAVDYLSTLGMNNLFSYEKELGAYVLEKLRALDYVTLYGHKRGESLAVFSFNVTGAHPHDGANLLDRLGIAVRSGHHCAQPLMNALGMDNTLRASFYFYNTKEEANRLIHALGELRKLFAR
ncbi:MAG: cysteine desulfurase [Acidobacteria bacterium]|nr:cysteine desulfurase [Acidobacteriota bacterium]